MSKRWIDLLGGDCRNCVLHGQYISREAGEGQFRVVYRADDRVMARRILEIWQAECKAAGEAK